MKLLDLVNACKTATGLVVDISQRPDGTYFVNQYGDTPTAAQKQAVEALLTNPVAVVRAALVAEWALKLEEEAAKHCPPTTQSLINYQLARGGFNTAQRAYAIAWGDWVVGIMGLYFTMKTSVLATGEWDGLDAYLATSQGWTLENLLALGS